MFELLYVISILTRRVPEKEGLQGSRADRRPPRVLPFREVYSTKEAEDEEITTTRNCSSLNISCTLRIKMSVII